MKKVLILVLSAQKPPWGEMMLTSMNTWERDYVEGVRTIFYCGQPVQENSYSVIYFDIYESYATLGQKMLAAFEWVLQNYDFDYIARVNSSCYVDKRELIKYVQTLPDTNVFAGVKVPSSGHEAEWCWGGMQFILSKDVVEKVVESKTHWRHDKMEDVALSFLVKKLGIPFMAGKGCSIDKTDKGWRCVQYGGGESFDFDDWSQMKGTGQFFIRVKYDQDRYVDKLIMHNLYNHLQ